MTLPAFGVPIELLAAGDALSTGWYLRGNCDGGRCFLLEFLREQLDMLHYLSPLPFREHTPAGHRGAWEAIGNGAEKVIIRWYSAAGSRADFIDAAGEITRSWENLISRRPGALTIVTVALGAFAGVDLLARFEILR